MKQVQNILLSGLTLLAFCMCSAGSKEASRPKEQSRVIPEFSADSAYANIARQLDFGPRVPGTEAQQQTAAWLESELERYGAKVYIQKTSAKAYDGTELPIINIVGSINPEAKTRVLMISHWDCRPICDNDPDKSKYHTPVPSANDGASGVGVLLELARLSAIQSPKVGVDIFFTDAEDYGAPDEFEGEKKESWWALGTQAWCRNPHVPGYRASYGILLDMVGAKGATFYHEYYSNHYAKDVVNRIWSVAKKLGYSNYFIDENGGGITDDHVFVNGMTGIPTVDIIDTRMEGDSSFFPYWHTSEDTLDKISKETLKAVGTVLTNLIY